MRMQLLGIFLLGQAIYLRVMAADFEPSTTVQIIALAIASAVYLLSMFVFIAGRSEKE
mgnify:CR=1 FL=1